MDATIAVASTTPVHADTTVGLDFQGLTGVPVIALEGGKQVGASTSTQTLIADPAAGQSMTQAARNALGRVDTVLAEQKLVRRAVRSVPYYASALEFRRARPTIAVTLFGSCAIAAL